MIWASLIVFTIVSMGLLLVYRLWIMKMAAGSLERESKGAAMRRMREEAGQSEQPPRD